MQAFVNGYCKVKSLNNANRYKQANKMQSETPYFAPSAATWRIEQNIRVVFDSAPFATLCENMTSSRKPEVHNILHCRPKRLSQPRPQVTGTENLVKYGRLIFEIC